MRIKLKKSFKLITFTSLVTLATLTPMVTISACNNSGGSTIVPSTTIDDSQPSKLGEISLPQNYNEAKHVEAIADFADKFTMISINPADLMSSITNLLDEINKTAYDGFDWIASYNSTDGWTLNSGRTIAETYEFFANRVNKDLFPTYQNFVDFFALNGDKFTTDNDKIVMLMYWYAYARSMVNMTKLLLVAAHTLQYVPTIPHRAANFIKKFQPNASICSRVQALEYADYSFSWLPIYDMVSYLYEANEKSQYKPLENGIAPDIIANHQYLADYVQEFLNKCSQKGIIQDTINYLKPLSVINDQGQVRVYYYVFTRKG